MQILRWRGGKAPWSAGRKWPAALPALLGTSVRLRCKFRWNRGFSFALSQVLARGVFVSLGVILMRLELVPAWDRLAEVRALFSEYARWLAIPLDFQNFQGELDTLPGQYAPPAGRLYLALADGQPAGCGALRPFDRRDGLRRCEMKRLFVRDSCRGLGLGRRLAERLIADARAAGYNRLLLDTFSSMTAALSLYQSLGFREIAPYRYNPYPQVRYLCLDLDCK